MGMTATAARGFARRNGLYTQPVELNFGLPIGCPIGTLHIDRPTPLEKLLLDHLHREILMKLDRLALQKEAALDLAQEEEEHLD